MVSRKIKMRAANYQVYQATYVCIYLCTVAKMFHFNHAPWEYSMILIDRKTLTHNYYLGTLAILDIPQNIIRQLLV